jgi:uncharacterized surface protein with fasciclin (FAS1) repeats
MKNNIFFLIAIFIFFSSCGDTSTKENNQPEQNTSNTLPAQKGQSGVVDNQSEANALQVAKSLDDFSTLVVAIKAAGVEDALVNAGPLTIFAPTNDAFGKLPKGTIKTLLKPENKSRLSYILINHVAPANYPDTQLQKEAKKGRKLYMASGIYLNVVKKDDGIYVGGTKVLKTVKVSNGWIHVIGDVLVPVEEG